MRSVALRASCCRVVVGSDGDAATAAAAVLGRCYD